MSKSNGVLMLDGSIRKHGVFPSYKVSDTEIVLDGLEYQLIEGKCLCNGCAFNYGGPSTTPECPDSGKLVSCTINHENYIWKLKSDQ